MRTGDRKGRVVSIRTGEMNTGDRGKAIDKMWPDLRWKWPRMVPDCPGVRWP